MKPRNSRTTSSVIASLVAAALLMAACGGVGTTPTTDAPSAPSAPAVTPSAALTTTTGTEGCQPVETIAAYSPTKDNQTHHEDGAGPALDTYTTVPPVSGPHAGTTLPAGAYDSPPPIENVLHSMEHGAAVIWYSPTAPAEEVSALAAFVAENQEHTIMAPLDYPEEGDAGQLPEGTQMALAAWQRLQLCSALSQDAVLEFLRSYRSPTLGGGAYLGEAPEPGFAI